MIVGVVVADLNKQTSGVLLHYIYKRKGMLTVFIFRAVRNSHKARNWLVNDTSVYSRTIIHRQ